MSFGLMVSESLLVFASYTYTIADMECRATREIQSGVPTCIPKAQ